MLEDIRNRVMRLFVSESRSGPERERSSRQHRADLVAGLQRDIRQLQQDISDLSDSIGDSEAEGSSRQMASLHRDLKEKQDELSRYQARI
jgi:uncharacterized protein YlxW (UPF0749 family)